MINIAILGFGTVGSGVAEVLDMNTSSIRIHAGGPVHLKYILDVRDFPDSPWKDRFVKDFSVIENDPALHIVVETIGGVGVALDFTRRALTAGKSVVTSNKELVATHGYELLQLAKEHNANYLFEASVGGGIPVLHPLTHCLAGNRIEEVRGILNGTTNYILTRMIRAGLSFEDALREAQANGYAERDPSADIEGHDACRKICILAALCFGRHVYPDRVSAQGITAVTLSDVAYAASCNCKIKLLGRALRMDDGKVCAYVAPHLVRAEDPLAGVEDVFNAICVRGNAVGDVMFYGRGAGKLPTASAVVSDVTEIAQAIRQDLPIENQWLDGDESRVCPPDGLEFRWYVRADGALDSARAALGEIIPLARADAPAGEIAFLTPPMTRAALDKALGGLQVQSLLRLLP